MRSSTIKLFAALVCILPAVARADDPPAAPAAGAEVTIIGNTMTNTYIGEKKPGVFVYALDGTPEIKAAVEKIMKEYPDKGLDADAAQKIQDEWTKNLKYDIRGPMMETLRTKREENVEYGSHMLALTGTVEEADGKRWLTVTKYANAEYTYPEKMLQADKPFVMPNKPPLELKVSDALSLKCIAIPPGKFFMGCPYYEFQRWQEDPPHMVTLTKPYYISEIPVTQEIFEAVTGKNTSKKFQDPKFPVQELYIPEINAFCKTLSEKTGRVVRLPTAAEWEYAARSGTSNPLFPVKHKDMSNPGGDAYRGAPGKVKAKAPNAWGLYDLAGNSFEIVSDGPVIDREPTVDPKHIPANDANPAGKQSIHFGKGGQNYPMSEVEFLRPEGNGDIIRFRVVVEATAEEAAAAPAK